MNNGNSERKRITGHIAYETSETTGHKVGTGPTAVTETKRSGKLTLEMSAEPEDFAGIAEGASQVAQSILNASQAS